jgi:PhzF family phenazine biosynthesis protein
VRIRIVDAFAEQPFTGNPAGVCLLDAWPEDAWMQRVAAELNLSETAFAHPRADGDWALRWFTPTVEVDLCGHATLATAHVLRTDGLADRAIRFHTRSGVLVAITGERITLDFPASPATRSTVALALVLGAEPAEVHHVAALRELLAVFDDERTVRTLEPDLAAIARLDGLRGVVVTAPASDFDFVSRVFLPAAGIPEDPVTGGAHTALAPFWAERLGRDELVAYQASARGGVIQTRVRGDRVHLTGGAITMLDGELLTGK